MKKSKSYLRATIEDVFTENPDEGDNAIIGVLVWQRVWNDYQDTDDLALLQDAFLTALSGTTISTVQAERTAVARRAFAAEERKRREAAAAKKAIADRKKAAAKAAAAKKAKASGKQSTSVEKSAEEEFDETITSTKLVVQAEWWSNWLSFIDNFRAGAGGKKMKLADFGVKDHDAAISKFENRIAGDQVEVNWHKKVRAEIVKTGVTRTGDLSQEAVASIDGAVPVT